MPNSEFERHNEQPLGTGHPVEYEARVFDYLDGLLSPAEASAVEAHLATCDQCLALCRRWQQLDARLSGQMERPSLPETFTRQLLDLTARDMAPARAESQGDWEARWIRAERRSDRLRWMWLLDGIGYGAMAGLLGLLLFAAIQGLPSALSAGTAQVSSQTMMNTGVISGLVLLLATCGPAMRKPVLSWIGRL